jgi:hypothetical protein
MQLDSNKGRQLQYLKATTLSIKVPSFRLKIVKNFSTTHSKIRLWVAALPKLKRELSQISIKI